MLATNDIFHLSSIVKGYCTILKTIDSLEINLPDETKKRLPGILLELYCDGM